MSADDRAWRLRDAAVRVIRECGRWEGESLGGLRLVIADWQGMRIVHRTPVQRPRHTLDPRTYTNALALAALKQTRQGHGGAGPKLISVAGADE